MISKIIVLREGFTAASHHFKSILSNADYTSDSILFSLLWINGPRENLKLSQVQSLCYLIELRFAKDFIEAIDMSAMHRWIRWISEWHRQLLISGNYIFKGEEESLLEGV
jgi:hypothetical protein